MKFASKALACLALLSGTCFSQEKQVPSDVVNLTKGNVVVLRGEVGQAGIAELMVRMNQLKDETVVLYINSPGGSVLAGMDLIQHMKNSDKKIVCVADMAISMAFAILQGCHERIVLDGSILMQHQASMSGIEGQVENLKTSMNFNFDLIERVETLQAKRIGISTEEMKKRIAHDWWLSGEQAVKMNVADKLRGVKCSKELWDEKVVETVMTFFGPIKLTFSSCPLAKGILAVEFSSSLTMEQQERVFKDLEKFFARDRNFLESGKKIGE